MSSFTREELLSMGFKSVGTAVRISRKASIYGADRISIGNNVRVDDFVVLSAGKKGIIIGSNVHIAIFSSLIGREKIILGDFCNISSRVAIYSSSDDYSGDYLTNPTIPQKFTNVFHKPVLIEKHCIIGSGSIILPGVKLSIGVAVGALSLVNKTFNEFTVVAGVPATAIKERSRGLLSKEVEFLNEERGNNCR